MTTALMLTTSRDSDGAPVLTAAGEIDMSNAETFAAALAAAVRPESRPLVVDLTAVEYLDSAGLAALFQHADRIEVVAGSLLTPLLTVSGLTDLTVVRGR
ncbi:STAS domain-containing protein [Actinoplanes regularis]|uniref:Anti-anti-sigma factor n=1 Tax=Actinoplanes regularis TaxID=52697 RepID=A0A238YC51_9ACTN|nr:STAS domain-containing protein [Actinoplanes regularis]GIE86013.1 anti-anti-sigma factor [Actinoplanes regularis]GLW27711.1 anti-anti-sigma factor [Actinoplanes regularis]SNR68600.1 anti-anti-sigma factor [Actinoplanes regularis]